MDYKILINILFFILVSKVVNDSDFFNYYFNFTLVDDTMKEGTFISPTISEDGYLYIVTGHDEDIKNNQSQRYIIKYDIETSSLVEQYHYNLSYGFYAGEAYAFNDKSQYIFSSSFSDSNDSHNYEVRHLKTYGINWQDNSIYGERRFFKKAGPSYYFVHYDENNFIYMKKMAIAYYVNYIPYFEIIKERKIGPYKRVNMISCDLTKDNNYILCSFFDDDLKVSLSAFDKNFNQKFSYVYNETNILFGFIKIVYFKENSVFVMMNSLKFRITRLRYFDYLIDNIEDKLYNITQNDYLDIQYTQLNGRYGTNDIITLNSEKIIKVSCSLDKAIITVIQFYDNDSAMSIKIYNMINENGFSNFQQSRISLLKNSFVFCASAQKNNIRRP